MKRLRPFSIPFRKYFYFFVGGACFSKKTFKRFVYSCKKFKTRYLKQKRLKCF